MIKNTAPRACDHQVGATDENAQVYSLDNDTAPMFTPLLTMAVGKLPPWNTVTINAGEWNSAERHSANEKDKNTENVVSTKWLWTSKDGHMCTRKRTGQEDIKDTMMPKTLTKKVTAAGHHIFLI